MQLAINEHIPVHHFGC